MSAFKRHPALQELSRDHQRFLIEARNIRWLMDGNPNAMSVMEVLTSFIEFWEQFGEMHLVEEEQILLPFYLAHDPGTAPDIRRILHDHEWLREQVIQLRITANESAIKSLLNPIGDHITSHIRFEERIFFQTIQGSLLPQELTELAEQFQSFRHQHRSPYTD